MKNWKGVFEVAAIILAIYVALQACNGCHIAPEEDTAKDLQGKDLFRTECVLLFGYIDHEKDLSQYKNGSYIPAKYQKADGKLRVNRKNYLICVLTGDALKRGEEFTTNLSFTLYDGASVKEDDECVRDVAIYYCSDFLGAQLSMSPNPNERLTLQNTATEENRGIIIIEFYPTATGDLMVDFSVKADEGHNVNDIDAINQGKIGTFFQDLDTAHAKLKTFEVGFFTEEEYQDGDFSIDTIRTSPPRVCMQPFYMVVYYELTTKVPFFKEQPFELVTVIKGKAGLSVEDASTSKIESFITEDIYAISTTFTIGEDVGSTKNGHVIYRVEPHVQGDCTVTAWLSSDMNLEADNPKFIHYEINFYNP